MSDFESRLRDALGSGADEAPDAVGLAHAVRGRARARRRTTLMLTAVPVVLAVVAVPVGVLALRDSGDSSTGPGFATDSPSPTGSVPDGWRTETWRDLEIQVPDTWDYGALSTWCIGNDTPGTPVVQRPEGGADGIACMPSTGYGLQFVDSTTVGFVGEPGAVVQVGFGGRDMPDGAWTGYEVSDGEAAVLVIAPSEAVAQRILDSAHTVDGVDSNGCALRLGGESSATQALSVCRYSADGWLEQSEQLSDADALETRRAIEAAPSQSKVRGPGPCTVPAQAPSTVLLRDAAAEATVTFGTGCVWTDGVLVGSDLKRLTPDVMYWALSPGWSGGVDGSVPLPPELRQR